MYIIQNLYLNCNSHFIQFVPLCLNENVVTLVTGCPVIQRPSDFQKNHLLGANGMLSRGKICFLGTLSQRFDL